MSKLYDQSSNCELFIGDASSKIHIFRFQTCCAAQTQKLSWNIWCDTTNTPFKPIFFKKSCLKYLPLQVSLCQATAVLPWWLAAFICLPGVVQNAHTSKKFECDSAANHVHSVYVGTSSTVYRDVSMHYYAIHCAWNTCMYTNEDSSEGRPFHISTWTMQSKERCGYPKDNVFSLFLFLGIYCICNIPGISNTQIELAKACNTNEI